MTSDKLSLSIKATRAGTTEIAELLKELRENKDLPSVEKMARKAVELRPDQPEFHFILGAALHNQGKAKAAEQAYAACLRLDPQNITALINLGNLQISAGQPAAGLAAINGALYLDPGNIEARAIKGRGLGIMGKPDEALVVFEDLFKELPNDGNTAKALALCHMQLGHKTKAAEVLSRAIELKPDDASLKAAMKHVTS